VGDTSIQWTNKTWNPIRARNKKTGAVGHYCELDSSGCANCYSSTMQRRFGMPTFPGKGKPMPEDIEVFLDERVLAQPLHWKKPAMIFPCSMTDLFGHWVSDTWLDQIFAVMALAKQHTFQVLTKRAKRMSDYLTDYYRHQHIHEAVKHRMGYDNPKRPAINGSDLPFANIWTGFSAENQATFDRRAADASPLMRSGWLVWVSAEPLIGPIVMQGNYNGLHLNWLGKNGIRFVVCGGESGRNARPCELKWIRSLINQCKSVEGCAFFTKQLGAKASDEENGVAGRDLHGEFVDGRVSLRLADGHGGNIEEWPLDLRIREFPEILQKS
jgi:protein gp37